MVETRAELPFIASWVGVAGPLRAAWLRPRETDLVPAAILLVVMGQLDTPASLFWVGLVLNFLITGSFGAGLGYNTELFPTQIRGTTVGAAFTFGTAAASTAPAIVGWIATGQKT